MHLTILTGASRGLGRALAAARLAQKHRVLALCRGTVDLVVPDGALLEHWSVDLADAAPVAERLRTWLHGLRAADFSSISLINNAGVVAPPTTLARSRAADLSQALRVGLEAPVLLTSAFLQATQGWPVPRKVLLISSGLGRRGMAGSTSYCAAKAGLDNLARALALEESAGNGGARVVSLAPGVIDTDMQHLLRTADRLHFPEGARFDLLKRQGQLDTPDASAARVLACMDRADFGDSPVADVRDA